MMLQSIHYLCKITGILLSLWLDTKIYPYSGHEPRAGSHSGQMGLGYLSQGTSHPRRMHKFLGPHFDCNFWVLLGNLCHPFDTYPSFNGFGICFTARFSSIVHSESRWLQSNLTLLTWHRLESPEMSLHWVVFFTGLLCGHVFGDLPW